MYASMCESEMYACAHEIACTRACVFEREREKVNASNASEKNEDEEKKGVRCSNSNKTDSKCAEVKIVLT